MWLSSKDEWRDYLTEIVGPLPEKVEMRTDWLCDDVPEHIKAMFGPIFIYEVEL